MTLDPSERATLEEHGYVVRPNVFTKAECRDLCSGVSEVVTRAAAECRRRGVIDGFWQAFARSAQTTEVFWDPRRDDLLRTPPSQWESAVMRIGHVLHRVAPFDALTRDPRLAGLLASAIAEPAELVQSAVIYKQPQSELVQFGWHQDSSYLPNEPESLVLVFVALDDMTEENGALEVIPRSHRGGLDVVYRLTPDGYVPLSSRRPETDDRERVILTVPRGTVIALHGRTRHASKPNRSTAPRRALIVHAKACASPMSELCWARGPFDPLPSFDAPQ